MQRLRIRFGRKAEVKYISHLDIMRLWQRAFIRADIPLAYSEGFSPHPRISLAMPLALGITSEAELMDVVLSSWVSPHNFTDAVSRQLPAGIEVTGAVTVAPNLPSLQSQISMALYDVEIPTTETAAEIEKNIAELLALETLAWEHHRDTGPHHYDIRRLIDNIRLTERRADFCRLKMRLRCDNTGTGRPEQVASALGFEEFPRSLHRTKLILKSG